MIIEYSVEAPAITIVPAELLLHSVVLLILVLLAEPVDVEGIRQEEAVSEAINLIVLVEELVVHVQGVLQALRRLFV